MPRPQQSRRPDSLRRATDADALPPHSVEAEQGVLGCIFLLPAECLAAARKRFGVAQPFFNLNHDTLFTTLCHMADEGEAIDLITVHDRLKQNNNLEAVGGLSYVAGLPDKVPSAANLDWYLKIVWGHYLSRSGHNRFHELARQFTTAGVTVETIAEAQRTLDMLREARGSGDGQVTPTHIKTLDMFAHEVFDAFFGTGADPEKAGRELPFAFPLRIRPAEMTFLLGEKGMGKSTLWSWIMVWLCHQGAKCFAASMEVRKRDTIKKAICQLIGRNRLADCAQGHKVLQQAQGWLLPRLVIFDFLGIVPWRELLDSMKRARQELGCDTFFVDSVMRIGVHADDIGEADECSKNFGDFATSHDCHLLVVNHLNKSDGDAKKRSRGTHSWIDNSHNVVSVLRNAKKAEKIGEIFANHKARVSGFVTPDELDAKLNDKDLAMEWDGRFYLLNQRLDGTQQNGSAHLWFDRSGQYRDDYNEASGVDYLERWTNNQQHKTTT